MNGNAVEVRQYMKDFWKDAKIYKIDPPLSLVGVNDVEVTTDHLLVSFLDNVALMQDSATKLREQGGNYEGLQKLIDEGDIHNETAIFAWNEAEDSPLQTWPVYETREHLGLVEALVDFGYDL